VDLYITRAEFVELKITIMRLCAKNGVVAVLEALTELASEFGEGEGMGKNVEPDPVWLAIAAHLSNPTAIIRAICESQETKL
jgi:hypothetical protein